VITSVSIRYNRIALLLAILIFIPITWLPLKSQESKFGYRELGELDEYTSVQTKCIFLDSREILWIGTRKGLSRWDSHRLISFPHVRIDSIHLSDIPIHSITEDSQNNLWFAGGADGLIKYNLLKEIFTRKIIPSDSSSYSRIKSVKYDPSGFLWLGSPEKLFKYYPESDSLIQFQQKNTSYTRNLRNEEAVDILSDTTGVMWISSHGKLCYLDRKLEKLLPHQFDKSDIADSLFQISRMSIDSHGIFWLLGRCSELAKFNPYTKELEQVWIPEHRFTSPHCSGGIDVDQQGRVWFGAVNGLNVYDPSSGITRTINDSDFPYMTRNILIDRRNNILVSSNEGVKNIDRKVLNIKYYSILEDKPMKGLWITQVIRDEETFWIGTYSGGVIRYNSETGEKVHYRHELKPGSLRSDNIFKIIKDKNNRIWIMAGREGNLHRYDPLLDRFEYFPFTSSRFITKDKDGYFWICGFNKLIKFDPIAIDTSAILLHQALPSLNARLASIPFTMDNQGNLWLGGSSGLFRINPENGYWNQYLHNSKHTSFPADSEVLSLLSDSENRLWVGSRTGLSMLALNQEGDKISWNNIFPDLDSAKEVTGLAEDADGNIWIGSYTGAHVLTTDGSMQKYTHEDGLPEQPRMIELWRDCSNGSIYAGKCDFAEIPQDFIENTDIPSRVLLTGFWISGEPVRPGEEMPLDKSILFADRIDLKHNQNFIRIDFASPSSTEAHINRYKYFLTGVDKDTIHCRERSFAEYTNLMPGRYTFRVAVCNYAGEWDQAGTSILIKVHPPWYRKLLALIIYAAIVVTLVLGLIRMRTKSLWRSKLRLEIEVENRLNEVRWMNEQILEMEAMKTRFFNNISHELRTLVALIKAPLNEMIEDLKGSRKQIKRLELVRRNADKLMKLVNQLLDISKIDKGNMKLVLNELDIYDFVHAIAVSFASMAEVKGINYRYRLPPTPSIAWFDQDKLEKIINNLLSNAFKYTDEGGKVEIDLQRLPAYDGISDALEITISDTGHGIPQDEQEKIFDRFYQAEIHLQKEGGGTGIGLALTYDLVELMHGSISIQSEVGKGSIFKVQMPLGRDHLNENEYQLGEAFKEHELNAEEGAHDQEYAASIMDKSPVGAAISENTPLALVVEDNADIRGLLADHLEQSFRVRVAIDGSAGLNLALELMPEIIITDLMMPRMDGLTMCSKLKADLRTSHIPIIILTARAALQHKVEGLETGADDYILKPFEIKELMARAKNLVEQRKLLRERFGNLSNLEPGIGEVSSVDQKFLNQVIEFIEVNMGNKDLDVPSICNALGVSRSTLFRKLNALTGLSPVEFIRRLRLKRAASLLKQQFGNVSEVALEVGFNNPSYFTRVFRKTYETSPLKYAKSKQKTEEQDYVSEV